MSVVIQSVGGAVEADGNPNTCPLCHSYITVQSTVAYPRYFNGNAVELSAVYICPNSKCHGLFIGYFDPPEQRLTAWRFRECKPRTAVARVFGKTITDTSSSFCAIYSEASTAEALDLKEICGVGYRKALEFLMKDYLLVRRPDAKDEVQSAALATCIAKFVDDPRIKEIAKRAVWLGNDETHFVRRWKDKDLADLKKLIDLTVHWVEMEALTKETLDGMNSSKST